jgi:hypothetical protein
VWVRRWSQAVSGILSFGSSNDVSQQFVRSCCLTCPRGVSRKWKKPSENLAANLEGRSKLVRIALYFPDCTTPNLKNTTHGNNKAKQNKTFTLL